jgi:hypothetical protein
MVRRDKQEAARPDIYVKDWYFVISKRFLIALIVVAFVPPLVTVTVDRLRSAIP